MMALAEPESQVDPKFQTSFQYTRLTAKAMRAALIDEKSWTDNRLPCVKTIGNLLNRLGFRLRRVQMAQAPQKSHGNRCHLCQPQGGQRMPLTCAKTRYAYQSKPRPRLICAIHCGAVRHAAGKASRRTTMTWTARTSCLRLAF